MRRALSTVIVALLPALGLAAEPSQAANELTALLGAFLAGASVNDTAMHDRFWADDLIYTGSSGRRIGKADILRDVKGAPPPAPGDPAVTYTAEEIRVQPYKDTAIVAFRLVGTTVSDGRTQVQKYLNTGTFVKRRGAWKAVAWQATKLPRPEDEAKEQVAAAEAALHRAMLAGDAKALEGVTDKSFIWTHRTGEPVTRDQLVEHLASGRLKYATLDTDKVTIAVYGDAAVVRGVSQRQRAAIPGSVGAADAEPFTSFYTMTFVNQADGWKAVAMHSSRPQAD